MWAKLKQQIWQWRGVLLAVPNVTVLVLLLRWSGLLQLLELTALDQFFLLRPQEPVDSRIVIVEINEVDITKQGQWPMNDRVLAGLLENIKQQQPRAIGLDVYRNLPVDPGYPELLQVIESTPNLIGVQKVAKSIDSSAVEPQPILKKLQQIGANDLPPDRDGKVRRGLLYLDLPNGDILESFGLKLALLYLKPEGITERPAAKNANYLQLNQAVFPTFEANDGGYVRADAKGYQVLLNYRGRIQKFPKISLTEVIENRIPPNLMRGKVVLIGATAESLRDLFYTPYTSNLFANPERMAGVTIHANLISQILSAALDGRSLIQPVPKPLEWFWILVWSIIGAALCWQQRHGSSRRQTRILVASLVLAGGGLIGVSFGLFLLGWWISVVPPLLALGGSAIAILQYVAYNAAKMQITFGRYLTEEIVANLLETPSGLKLGGERRKVTILVSDVRGFSAISEQLPPEQVVTILNLYLGVMTDVINHYKGTINEFIGDGIFVTFGAPISRPDDSQRAIACAIAMQLAMEQVNEQNQQMNFPILEMGIGINTGEVVAGNIGSQKRAQYTVIGSHVNLAARIETYTVGGQILVSENTCKDANVDLRIDGQLQVEPKGIKYPITIYDIGGIGGEHNLFLPQVVDDMVSLHQELPIEYVVLQGKHAVGTVFSGEFMRLSANTAQLRTNHKLEPLSNLKLKLLTTPELPPDEADVYAKVIKKLDIHENDFLIRFTAVPPQVIALFNTIIDSH
jgi:adenylate cyclase